MEDFFALILFLLFVLVPLLTRKKKEPPPPTTRPQERQSPPRTRPEYTRPYPGREEPAAPTHAQDTTSAAEMLPAELWEILTGQKPPLPVPPPRPQPDYDEAEDELAAIGDEGESAEGEGLEREPEIISLEDNWQRPEPIRPSLEVPLQQPVERHGAFHQRLAALQPIRVTRVARSPLPNLLDNRDALKRAIILREVLGPPKALE